MSGLRRAADGQEFANLVLVIASELSQCVHLVLQMHTYTVLRSASSESDVPENQTVVAGRLR